MNKIETVLKTLARQTQFCDESEAAGAKARRRAKTRIEPKFMSECLFICDESEAAGADERGKQRRMKAFINSLGAVQQL